MRQSLLLSGLCALLAQAAQLTVSIPPSPPILANPNLLPPTTQATLLCAESGQVLKARLSRTNTLVFPSLSAGSHLLTIHTRDYAFAPYRIDVSDASIVASQTFRGHEWGNKGPVLGEVNSSTSLTVEVRPLARKDFYQAREGFSTLSVFKNPMILMALVSGALIFGMPYLIDNMDEETRAEFEEVSKKGPMGGALGGDPASALSNFDLAGWLAGGSSSSSSEKPKASAEQSGGTKSLR
ncbi:hypothetical protein ANO11243_005880 [Dothideomycetidae sp. 11243]|nr:hypothetical protein ANO11243_005880 [fungal sp. No.11243]